MYRQATATAVHCHMCLSATQVHAAQVATGSADIHCHMYGMQRPVFNSLADSRVVQACAPLWPPCALHTLPDMGV